MCRFKKRINGGHVRARCDLTEIPANVNMRNESAAHRKPIITVKLSISKTGRATALLDSGADLCVIRLHSLANDVRVNTNEKMCLTGFTNKAISTFGTCIAVVELNNKSYKQKFHVVPDTVKMSDTDIILGENFLRQNKIILDFGAGLMIN